MSAAAAASSHAVPIAASATPPGGCGCSAQTHDALKADLTTWRALPLDSYWGHGPTLRRLCNALSLPMPGDEGLYLCLDGIAAEHLRCVVIEALAEHARRRRDSSLFGALVFPNPTGRFRRATLRSARRDHDLAKQLLALLQPDGNSLVAEVFVAPPVARRRSRLPARRLPCPLPRPPRPHG